MSTENNSSDGNAGSTFMYTEVAMSRTLRFWLMLFGNVPLIICALYLICYIITNRVQRYGLHNHTILLILIFGLPIQLMDINFYLVFFHYGVVLPSIPIVCRLWWLADYGFYCGGIIFMAWLAFERHILIFHDQLISNRRRRFLFHYLPLLILIGYLFIFYTIVNFLLPCENIYVYTVPVCGASPCYQSYGILGMWEYIANVLLPILLESIFSTSLMIRVYRQKRRLRQSNQWSKQRRMIIQLVLVSSSNAIINTPIFFIPLLRLFGLPPDFGLQPQLFFFYFGYFVIFLFPFVSLCQYPDLRKKIKQKLFGIYQRPHRTGIIAPVSNFPKATHG